MLKRVLIVCLLVSLPGILFLVIQFLRGYSLEVESMAQRAERDFALNLGKDIDRFRGVLEDSENILKNYATFNESYDAGLPDGVFDWESFSTKDCRGAVNFSVFLSCFKYMRKANDDGRKLGAVYTWLRMVKVLSPEYFKIVHSNQSLEQGIEMSPEKEGYHWLNFNEKKALFFYQYSFEHKQGFAITVDPLLLWDKLNLAPLKICKTDSLHSHQRHPIFSSMCFDFKPDREKIRQTVLLQNIMSLGFWISFLLLIIVSLSYFLKLFLSEIEDLAKVASEWVPGQAISFEGAPIFNEVLELRNVLDKRSEQVIKQSRKFAILRRLQGVNIERDLLAEFRKVLGDQAWSPQQSDESEWSQSSFHKHIKKIVQSDSEKAFTLLIEKLYSYKKIFSILARKAHLIDTQDAYLNLASETQRLLLLNQVPRKIRSLSWDVFFLPGQQVAGDFYLVDHRGLYTYFCVADVAGKGLQAGLFAARIKAALDGLVDQQLDLPEMFKIANDLACNAKPEDSFCTCFMGRFSHANYSLEFCSAGHNGMLLMKEGVLQKLSSKGLPFGLIEGAQYQLKTEKLSPRDRLLIFSDGCIELQNSSDDILGKENFEKMFQEECSESKGNAIESLSLQLDAFQSGTYQADDITMLLVDV